MATRNIAQMGFAEVKSKGKGFPNGFAAKNLPAMQEMQVQFLHQEDTLEKEMSTHSNIFA